MPRLFKTLAALALFVPTGASQAAENVSTFTLENGLDAVVIEDHRAPVVVHMLWYKAGAADEPPGKSGIAHFLEHLMFKGTDELAPGEFSRVVSANGGSDNAFTSWDYTAYHQRVAADRLELMMKMEADRMRDIAFTGPEVETERDVILEERSQRTDNNPGALFGETRRAALYLNHPYGIPIIGWRHEMEGLTRQDALDFYRQYYAPNNAILVVAGDVDPAEVEALAKIHYGPLEPTPGLRARTRPSEPPQLAERRIPFSDPRAAQPYVARTYLAPARDPGQQEEAAALEILAALLGGNPATSFLGKRLQYEQNKAIYTSAFYSATSYDPSGFGLVIVPAAGVSLAEAETALDDAVQAFIDEGVDADQLARIKHQIRADQVYALDSVRGQAQRYGQALSTGLTVKDVREWPALLQSVSEEDILNAAQLLLDKKRAVTGWYMNTQAAAEIMQ